jgi:hypothetical protein
MAAESVLGAVRLSVVRRWLEVLLPVYTLGSIFVWWHQDYMPSMLAASMSESPLPWVAWAVVGGMTGILALWTLIVGFFLVYSPFYLLGKVPVLLGRGPWVDKHELHFYLCCFVLLALLSAISYWDGWIGLMAFMLLSGCGPVFWRYLV